MPRVDEEGEMCYREQVKYKEVIISAYGVVNKCHGWLFISRAVSLSHAGLHLIPVAGEARLHAVSSKGHASQDALFPPTPEDGAWHGWSQSSLATP